MSKGASSRAFLSIVLGAVLVIGGNQIALSADPGADPPSPFVQDTSGGWLNTATHVYEPYPVVRNGQTLLLGAFWMFSARHLRIKVESLSAPALAASLAAQLPNYWQRATRGLGQAEIVDGEYDVHLFAVGGEGISNHKDEQVLGRWTSVQYVYESNYGVRANTEATILIALHEIGHNWCCEGPLAGTDVTNRSAYGHYLNLDDGLMGVVDDAWAKGHGFAGCPTDWCTSPSFHNGVFSARELATMGIFLP